MGAGSQIHTKTKIFQQFLINDDFNISLIDFVQWLFQIWIKCVLFSFPSSWRSNQMSFDRK